jgi:hypothetical protein
MTSLTTFLTKSIDDLGLEKGRVLVHPYLFNCTDVENLYFNNVRVVLNGENIFYRATSGDLMINPCMYETHTYIYDTLIEILDSKGIGYDYTTPIISKNEPPVKRLNRIIKCSVVSTKDTCCIDLEEYDELVKTKCGHLFAVENLCKWVLELNNKTCPYCRSNLQ